MSHRHLLQGLVSMYACSGKFVVTILLLGVLGIYIYIVILYTVYMYTVHIAFDESDAYNKLIKILVIKLERLFDTIYNGENPSFKKFHLFFSKVFIFVLNISQLKKN